MVCLAGRHIAPGGIMEETTEGLVSGTRHRPIAQNPWGIFAIYRFSAQ